jgi:hypothetical protein
MRPENFKAQDIGPVPGYSIEGLKAAIRQQHGCDSKHERSAPTVVKFRNQTIWQGIVEVFGLINHPFAKRCFAWRSGPAPDNPQGNLATVLESGPVSFPETAVYTSMVTETKAKPGKAGRVYKVCFFAHDAGKNIVVVGDVEFIGDRAFLISEYWPVAGQEVKAGRIEIDPALLQTTAGPQFDYFYRALVPLPQAKDN